MLSWVNLVARELPRNFPNRPQRLALRFQFLATFGIAVIAGCSLGGDAAASAILGGMIMIIACSIYAILTARNTVRTAVGTLRTLARAECAKVAAIVFQLWFVFTVYERMVPAIFVGSFIVAVLIYPVALLARD